MSLGSRRPDVTGPPGRRYFARDDLLRTERAAAFTGLTPRQIKHYAETGKLPYEVVAVAGRPIRLYRRSVLARLVAPIEISA